ncbi:hypothetical protein AVEN_91159-1 [Araneus ventricosus]|uniref:Uncharacterized protein n=1 Tax=Araneus ventricosus TaxID=182803 RepID=A0A4Y2E3V7_ARAVE|nr:hypothetical protein AVEN_91159-1 [Araneus ventricosus]
MFDTSRLKAHHASVHVGTLMESSFEPRSSIPRDETPPSGHSGPEVERDGDFDNLIFKGGGIQNGKRKKSAGYNTTGRLETEAKEIGTQYKISLQQASSARISLNLNNK